MDPAETDQQEASETFDEGALMEAAIEAVESQDETVEAPDGEAKETGKTGQTGEQGTGLDLASLRAIAAERSAAQQGQQKAEPAEAKPAPDLAQLADQLTGAGAYKSAAAKLMEGDGSDLAKLLGVDEATIYERWTDRALRGDASSMEAQLKAQREEIEALKAAKLPDDVVTTKALEEREMQKQHDENRRAFSTLASDAEKHPVLSAIDAKLRLQYGFDADQILRDSGTPLTIENLAAVAEKLAAEQLGGLLKGQQSSARASQSSGDEDSAAAPSENSGSSRAGVTIDNRTAAESASPLPDYFDESAYVARARKVAESL